MNETKIGDIIQPTTPARLKDLGQGIVVAVKLAQRQPVRVIFPSKNALFTVWDFSEDHVCEVKVNEEQRKEIRDAVYNYKRMSIDNRGI